jgi:hypothetical protein
MLLYAMFWSVCSHSPRGHLASSFFCPNSLLWADDLLISLGWEERPRRELISPSHLHVHQQHLSCYCLLSQATQQVFPTSHLSLIQNLSFCSTVVWLLNVPQTACVEHLDFSMVLWQGGRNLWKVESIGSFLVIGDAPERRWWDVSLFHSLFPTCLWNELVSSATCSHHDVLGLHRTHSSGVYLPWTETSKTISQHKPFLFISQLAQVLVIILES